MPQSLPCFIFWCFWCFLSPWTVAGRNAPCPVQLLFRTGVGCQSLFLCSALTAQLHPETGRSSHIATTCYNVSVMLSVRICSILQISSWVQMGSNIFRLSEPQWVWPRSLQAGLPFLQAPQSGHGSLTLGDRWLGQKAPRRNKQIWGKIQSNTKRLWFFCPGTSLCTAWSQPGFTSADCTWTPGVWRKRDRNWQRLMAPHGTQPRDSVSTSWKSSGTRASMASYVLSSFSVFSSCRQIRPDKRKGSSRQPCPWEVARLESWQRPCATKHQHEDLGGLGSSRFVLELPDTARWLKVRLSPWRTCFRTFCAAPPFFSCHMTPSYVTRSDNFKLFVWPSIPLQQSFHRCRSETVKTIYLIQFTSSWCNTPPSAMQPCGTPCAQEV